VPADVLAHVSGIRERLGTLRAESRSDVRLEVERVNVSVLFLGAWGGKLRVMAMNPQGGVAADLASDGASYCFLDVAANCGECDAVSEETVARLLRIDLLPDDVFRLLVGSTPLLASPEASLAWDSSTGHEVLTLTRDGWDLRIALSGDGQRFDVVSSELRGPDGKRVWRIRHKDFHAVKNAQGQPVRLPSRSFFEQPGNDVLIVWKAQELDVALDENKFRLSVPSGLRRCGKAR
jgi:hypothetical protein